MFAFLMVVAMSDPAAVDPPKTEPKKDAGPTAPFTEVVTVKVWQPADKRFTVPAREGVWAFRMKSKAGEDIINLKHGGKQGVIGGQVPAKSEIIDKDGNTFVVTKTKVIDEYFICVVTTAPKPEKKP